MLVVIVTMGAAHGPNTSEASKAIVGPSPKTPASQPEKSKTQKPKKAKPFEVGRASWYGQYFHGRPTASGEPYNMHLLTAAHPQLPLGTYVKVTSLRNGNSVVVRINDRGPVVPGRIIDVSYGAAKTLGFQRRGIERVRLDILPTDMVARAGMQ